MKNQITNDHLEWLDKVRTICCASWGIPPWEFDAACESGKVSISMIDCTVDYVRLLTPRLPLLDEWLRPGTLQRQEEEREEREMIESARQFLRSRKANQ